MFESLIQAVKHMHTITGARVIVVPIHHRVEGSPNDWLYKDRAEIVNALLRTRPPPLPGYVTVPAIQTALHPSWTRGMYLPARHHFDEMGVHPVGRYRRRYIKSCIVAILRELLII